MDELIPVSRGGSPYDPANCAAAHACCNNWRKTKPVGQVEAIRAQLTHVAGGWSGPEDFVEKARALYKGGAMAAASRPPTPTTDW